MIPARRFGKIGGEIGGVPVRYVDPEVVRYLGDPDFVTGGHGYVYPKVVPKSEIWLDSTMDPQAIACSAYHEVVERQLMRLEKMSYDRAHDAALKVESEMRADLMARGIGEEAPLQVAGRWFARWKRLHRSRPAWYADAAARRLAAEEIHMFQLREAYIPPIQRSSRVSVRVGVASQAFTHVDGSDSARTALWVGIPALVLGAGAYLLGAGATVVLLVTGAGGLGGYVIAKKTGEAPSSQPEGKQGATKEVCLKDLDAATRAPIEEAIGKNDGHALSAFAAQAREHGWECAATELDQKARVISTSESSAKAMLDIEEVAKVAGEPISTALLGAFKVFVVVKKDGKIDDAHFDTPDGKSPGDVIVKQVENVIKLLADAGYTNASSQLSNVLASAQTHATAPVTASPTDGTATAITSTFAMAPA
jgi:hypothetical protein